MKVQNVLAVALCASLGFSSAASETYYWCGGADQKWSTAANWSPQGTPGATDTVVFNAQSGAGAVYVDADFAGTVKYLSIEAGFGGSVTMQRDLNVQHTFAQSNGTFTCGANNLRLGSLSTRSYSSASRHGNFQLSGGVFNAPSKELQYYSVSHQVYFKIDGGSFNHCNGNFIIETSCGGGVMDFHLENIVFNDFTVRRAPGNNAVTSLRGLVHTNTVTGTFTMDSGSFATSGAGRFVVKGDLEMSGVASGGEMLLVFDTADDQYVRCKTTGAKAPQILVEKPAGTKLIFDGGSTNGLWVKAGGYSQSYGGFKVVSGGVDLSRLSYLALDSYHSAFYIADGCTFVAPPLLKLVGYFGYSSLYLKDRELNNLYVATTDGRLNLGASTNTVNGDLTVAAGGLGSATAYIKLKGDYHVDDTYNRNHAKQYGGGAGWVVMDADSDQTITVTNGTCNSLLIEKPEGRRVTVDSPDGVLWLGHFTGSYLAGEGSLDMRSGVLDVSAGGIIMTNGCYGTLKQTGGEILWGPRGLITYIQNSGHAYNLNFGGFVLPRFESAGARAGSNSINLQSDLHVTNFVQNGGAVNGNGTIYIYGDHTLLGDTKKAGAVNVRYAGAGDQRLRMEEGAIYGYQSGRDVRIMKTGGTLTLDSDVSIGNGWQQMSVRLVSGNLDLNGHVFESTGSFTVGGRAVFTGGGQIRAAGSLQVSDGATLAFDPPTAAGAPAPLYAGGWLKFPEVGKTCNLAIEVLRPVAEASVSPVLLGEGGTGVTNDAYSSLATKPSVTYVLPYNVRKPGMYYGTKTFGFTWLMKKGLALTVR